MILFVRPQDGGNFRSSYSFVEPLGVEYLSAILNKEGITNEYLDLELFQDENNIFAEILKKRGPDIVGFSLNYPQACLKLRDLLKIVKKIVPDAVIIAGGQFASSSSKKILDNYNEIDFICKYEAEEYIFDFVKSLKNKNYNDIPNIVYREGEHVVENRIIERINDLDSLPIPFRSEKHIKKLISYKKPLSVIGSRGCWWGRCSYCAIGNSMHHHRWIGRSVSNIVAEIEYLKDKYGISNFTFVDAEFLGPPSKSLSRAVDFANNLTRRNIKITFSVNLRPENITKNILSTLKSCGLRMIFLGLESYASAHLNRWNRNTSQELIERTANTAISSSIPFRTGFIMFDPLSKLEDIKQNIDFLLKFPVIEPSLLVRGLEIRDGMPLKENIELRCPKKKLFGGYFIDESTYLFVKIIRGAFGKILLFIHNANELAANHKDGGTYNISDLEKYILNKLLDKMSSLFNYIEITPVENVKIEMDSIVENLQNELDSFALTLL